MRLRSKRFSEKLLPSASYALSRIALLCFCVYFFTLSFTSYPANELPHSLSITNHSSLQLPHSISITNHSSLELPHSISITNHSSLELSHSISITNHFSLELPHSISITNHSSLSASPPPPVYVYEKPCDYTNGRWVRTKRGPPYNATNCVKMKRNQNCIANGRPDLGYLYWRWKPSECHLPRFDPNTFLQLISNKHVAFVGDSVSRNHLESLLCLLATVTKPTRVRQPGCHRWHFSSHNAVLSFYWSPFLVQGVQRKLRGPPHYNTIYLDRVNMRWEKDVEQIDMIVLSLGHWFSVPSVFYWGDKVLGCMNRPVSRCTKDIGFYGPIRWALRTALNSIIKRKVRKNGIDVIVRTYSPSHFEGAWDKGGTCSKTMPYGVGQRQLEGRDAVIRRIQMEEVEKAKAKAKKFRGFRLEVMDVTKIALLRPDGHPGAYMNPFPFANGVPKKPVQNDCVHWCLPGPIDTWSEVFLQMLKNMARPAKE